MTRQLRECRLCHRVGYGGYLPGAADNADWECANDRACRARASKRAAGRAERAGKRETVEGET